MDDSARAIENLVHLYAERIDDGDFASLAELFRHGRIVRPHRPPAERHLVGVAEVQAMYDDFTRLHDDGTPRTHHVTTNLIVEVDEDAGSAAARSYFTVFQQTDTLALQPIIAGRYHDTFHRLDGTWWFESRTMFGRLHGALHEHLSIDLP